jgi:pyruvate/2-oxoglutarate dehydrogenase complex dihydrolipoamide acyltransferase (E2) component
MTAEQHDLAVRAPLTGTVIAVAVGAGDQVEPGDELLILESMKMEHAVVSEDAGKIIDVTVRVGETVTAGTPLVVIEPREHDDAGDMQQAEVDLGRVRPDLDEAIRRHQIGSDSYRREATERRHAEGRRTARENIADLVDDRSFVE